MRNEELSFKLWQNVDRCRESYGYTLADLSSFTDIKEAKLKNWRTRMAIPQADELYRIARALNTTVEFLLTGQKMNETYDIRVRAIADWLSEDEGRVSAMEKIIFGEKAGQSSVSS